MKGKVIFGLIVAATMMAVGCGGKGGGKADGPEAVVTAFGKAVATGQWDEAYGLCDTLTMKEYISANQQAWEYLEMADSNAFAIAAELLMETEVTIKAIEKVDGGRDVLYTITSGEYEKERKASVMKVEGKWKVAAITDVN